MQVLAVSHALPVEHTVGRMKIKTSIVHTPLVRPDQYIELDETGVRHNATAAHDGPVYICLAENYDYWCRELGVDRKAWDWCHWGENMTLRCTDKLLTEADFHLGDVWQVGGDVQLQVCGSRVPCMKLSWRCGQKDSWLKPLADTGRVGVYLRVLRGGRVFPGDRAVLTRSSGDAMDAASISRLAFDASLKTRDTFNLLANHPVLLRLNRFLMQRKVTSIDDRLAVGRQAWKGWRGFRPVRIVAESAHVKSFYLEPVDGGALAYYQPGQFLTVRLPDGTVRNWTISDWPGRQEPAYYRITIKAATQASAWMHRECTTDTLLSVRAPAGRFMLDWTQTVYPRHIYMSAGIGITPMLAMIKAHASHPSMQSTPGIWIHVTQDGSHSIFGDEFARIPNNPVTRVLFLTQPRAGDVAGRDYDYAGRPDGDTLAKLIGQNYDMNPLGGGVMSLPASFSKVYICGPTAFEATAKAQLHDLGFPPTFVHSENFAARGGAAVGDVERARVRFAKSGRTATWRREKPVSLLELAEELGLTPEYGCRVGACGSCAAEVKCGAVAGPVQMDGRVLTCSATPASDEVVVDL